MNLYELNRAIAGFDLEIDEETGEILNGDDLDKLEMERSEKIENIALWIKDLNAEAAAIKAEEQNLSRRRKTAENKAEWLRSYIQDALGGEKLKTARVAVSYRTTEAVEIIDQEEIPEAFLTIKTEVKPDKKAIKDAIKNGGTVPGTELVKRTSVQIK